MLGRRRLSSRILVGVLAILAVTSAVGFVLLAHAQRGELDRQAEQRALAIAWTTAAEPQIRQAMEYGGGGDVVQTIASRIELKSGASYVVVIDLEKVRHSHPIPDLIGKAVEEPIAVLKGNYVVGIDNGATGRSANAKVPLYGPTGRLVGEVSVGIGEKDIVKELGSELSTFALYIGIALGLGAVAAYLLARSLKRSTFGLELHEIAGLLQDREAMLHGIREGVIAFDPAGRVSVVNDEARRLLGLGTALGQPLEELLPEGRLRRALSGELQASSDSDELHVLTDSHCLAVNRMPVVLQGRELGAVVTVRDRTEIVGLLRELDSVSGLTDALRAQQHEFANRMHTLAGLLELGEQEQALEYAVELAGAERGVAAQVRERIDNSLLVGLVVAKTTVAAERGVRLLLDPDSRLGHEPGHLRRLLTVVGNLLDNAVDAASGSSPAEVRLLIRETEEEITVRVADTGPGIPPGCSEVIFEDGWSTSPDRGTARRGLGLALVHRLVTRHGGTIEVSEGPGAVLTVRLPLPDDDPAPLGAVFTVAPPVLAQGGTRW